MELSSWCPVSDHQTTWSQHTTAITSIFKLPSTFTKSNNFLKKETVRQLILFNSLRHFKDHQWEVRVLFHFSSDNGEKKQRTKNTKDKGRSFNFLFLIPMCVSWWHLRDCSTTKWIIQGPAQLGSSHTDVFVKCLFGFAGSPERNLTSAWLKVSKLYLLLPLPKPCFCSCYHTWVMSQYYGVNYYSKVRN